MVGALSCETGFAGLMLNKVVFHDARASLIQKLELLLLVMQKNVFFCTCFFYLVFLFFLCFFLFFLFLPF